MKPATLASTRRPSGVRCVVARASPAPGPGGTAPGTTVRTAREAALAYYDSYNKKDIASVLELIAEDCVYEDLIYAEPFRGRTAIAAYFDKIEQLVPADIKFVVEDITDGDPRRVGVRWHVELEGVAQFPFSRGVSFYETDAEGRIVFARDIVEPTIKPGAASLKAISVLAPLVRKLGPAADPANAPLGAAAMGAFYLSYIAYVMLSTAAPGAPVWATTPETIQGVLHESYNFFYVNIGLAAVGANPVPCIAEHPVSEALFNFVNAWSLMMWPAWVADPLSDRLAPKTKQSLFVGTMFLTNVFAPVYMALRLVPENLKPMAAKTAAPTPAAGLPGYAPLFGAMAMGVGAFSVAWLAAARPEYGDLASRLQFLADQAGTDRVTFAFLVDCCVYSWFQAWLLGDAGAAPWQRFTPYFGMAAWLLGGSGGGSGEEEARKDA